MEQDFVPITPGTGASIDADDLAGVLGGGPYRQRFTMADMAIAMKAMLQLLSNLGMAVDPLSGRLRVLLDPAGGAQPTLAVSGVITTVTGLTAIGGFGPAGVVTTDARFLPLEAMYTTWAQAIRPCIV